MKKERSSTLKKISGICLIALSLLIISPNVKAQEGIRFGVKGGLNYSTLAVDLNDVSKENGRIGLQGGVFAKIPLADKVFYFQPEILFSSQGSKLSYDPLKNANFANGEEVRFNTNYINVPLLAALSLGPIDLQAGVYTGYLLNANVTNLNYTDAVDPTVIARYNVNDFNRLDYGLAGGIAINSKSITIGARYNYGLREIGNGGVIRTITSGSRNQVLQGYIGVMF